MRYATGSVVQGYTTVFVLEAALFIVAAILASRIGEVRRAGEVSARPRLSALGETMLSEAREVRP